MALLNGLLIVPHLPSGYLWAGEKLTRQLKEDLAEYLQQCARDAQEPAVAQTAPPSQSPNADRVNGSMANESKPAIRSVVSAVDGKRSILNGGPDSRTSSIHPDNGWTKV